MIAPAPDQAYATALRAVARSVPGPDDLPDLLESLGDARIVMLGEATHGTSEFYAWRRAISERLIRDFGFNFIAVEGDWPDCQRVHRCITLTSDETPQDALAGYRRFPTWMWCNQEVLDLVIWMRDFNLSLPGNGGRRGGRIGRRRKVGFHGLDVYSLHDSMRLVVDYLERVDRAAAVHAKRAYACFEPYGDDPDQYAYATRFVAADCEPHVVAALSHMERLERLYSRISPDHVDPAEAYFDAVMNARVTRNAEAYYRTMIKGAAASWNIRDRHMMETLELLLEHYGAPGESRAIIWAHNTHIGDYRATDMLRAGYVNIGGLARERFGKDAVRLIGFGTHRGTVMATKQWDEDGEVMTVPPAAAGSLEDHLHHLGMPHAVLALRDLPDQHYELLNRTVGHRAIGVVYDPSRERPGNYVPTQLADRYDEFVFIDETSAVHSLGVPADMREEPEAYPTGM